MATIDYAKLPPTLDSLNAILERLRAPDGCPWDREQTRETLARCLNEECAELLEAIDHNEPDAICDELGDLLMNIVFQTVVAAERGEFTLTDVLAGINAKMVRRHAHIFGDETAATAADVVAVWEKIKSRETNRPKRESLMDGVPAELSALNRAEKLQKRAAKVGFDWSEGGQILDKIQEELDELKAAAAAGDDRHTEEELGDLLFAVANYSRFRQGRTAEELLRAANDKFSRRFRYIENRLKSDGIPLESAGIDRMESLWQQAKHDGI